MCVCGRVRVEGVGVGVCEGGGCVGGWRVCVCEGVRVWVCGRVEGGGCVGG